MLYGSNWGRRSRTTTTCAGVSDAGSLFFWHQVRDGRILNGVEAHAKLLLIERVRRKSAGLKKNDHSQILCSTPSTSCPAGAEVLHLKLFEVYTAEFDLLAITNALELLGCHQPPKIRHR